jgi:two-component system OmpR family sensor kinase
LAERAFDRFVHGTRTQVATRGSSGLGLPIVAAIVAAHAGTVTLTSAGTGTSVVIRLPTGAPNE